VKIGFGTQLWLRDNHFENFYRMLDEMSLEGLDGFECCYPFLIEWYERRPRELRQLLDMHDIEVASYYTGVTFYDPDSRAAGVAEVKRRIRFMAELGYEQALLDGGRKREGITPQQLDDQIKLIAETANALGAYAHECGIKLAWHQHWGSIFEVQAPFHRFMELLDPELVQFCCDVGQLALGDFDVVETVARYADRIGFMHYKDVTFAGRPEGERWPGGIVAATDEGGYSIDAKGRWVELGRGCVDFPAVTRVLREAGYDGYVVDDFDFTGYPPRASVKACKDYINLACGIWSERDIRRGIAPAEAV